MNKKGKGRAPNFFFKVSVLIFMKMITESESTCKVYLDLHFFNEYL